ncbi:MAG: YbaB/EbfC family nucleoid-associated protein [Armatimonadetes bacterium]|nr:YbaB/EbfC family nucleoid-associated protein [Armatimonadota bacterium]
MRGFGNAGGMGNMAALMKKAQQAMDDMQRVQGELDEVKVEGSSGGGMVRVQATASGMIEGLQIDPQVVDPEDVEMLQDLIMSAITDALQRAEEVKQQRIGQITQGLPIPPGFLR